MVRDSRSRSRPAIGSLSVCLRIGAALSGFIIVEVAWRSSSYSSHQPARAIFQGFCDGHQAGILKHASEDGGSSGRPVGRRGQGKDCGRAERAVCRCGALCRRPQRRAYGDYRRAEVCAATDSLRRSAAELQGRHRQRRGAGPDCVSERSEPAARAGRGRGRPAICVEPGAGDFALPPDD